MSLTVISQSEEETADAAKAIAHLLDSGDILLLSGDLGAGKTVFARALLRALSKNPDLIVPSPTFTLLQTYEIGDRTVYHFDLYRLGDSDEIYEIGWEEALSGGIVLVEWPERLDDLTPAGALRIEMSLDQEKDTIRHIEFYGDKSWRDRLGNMDLG